MSRKNDSSDILVGAIITLITALFAGIIASIAKIFTEAGKSGQQKDVLISLVVLIIFNLITFNLGDIQFVFYGLIISLVLFFGYWFYTLSNSPYKQFSKTQITQNTVHWSEQQWWWTLDGWRFEEEVAKIFILQGYNAEVTKGSGDGGVDIILTKENYKAIVQCKHYHNPVPPEPLRALWGVKNDFYADEVILVASSGITQAGAEFLKNKPDFKIYTLNDIITMSKMANKQYIAN